ncbi:ATP-binding protein [Dolichospermum sp. UHCC 0259]|uniref:PAS domain-containing hybrid sensor histidine kinase/response regulator n=1 Tax=Dolichospermum sp. UHCC 0259 TaxID=2590010 RepID=UPI001447AC4D|nr:ATP-binding protein [Dolichospermum sp. UHCC 0259]MTJ47789.1 PAS domain S-box protein [Dolichospermum sp. UHCC 0259]
MLNINYWRIRNLLKIPAKLVVVKATSAMPLASAAIAIFVGSLGLLGWYFDIEILKLGFPGSPATMKANTALCFLLSGLSLWLSQIMAVQRSSLGETRRILYLRISQVCAVTVAGIGLLTIIQYLFGWNFGIDELLFRDSTIVVTTFSPGRMGINTALSFSLIGLALHLIIQPRRQRSYWVAQIFTIITALISFHSVIGYAYKEQIFYSLVAYARSMALHTAVTLMLPCIGILGASSKQGLMRVITNDSYGGVIARRLLFPAIIIPFVVGWLILSGQRAMLYDPGFAISLFAIVLIIVFSCLVWQSALVIDRLTRQRYRAEEALKMNEEKLQSFVNANIIGILFGDVYGGIEQGNDEFLRIVGYTQEDILAGRINWLHLTPPEYLDFDEQVTAQAQSSANGTCVPFKKEYIRKDGSRVPVLVGFVLVGEKREKSVAFILDLTEQQAAVTELQKSEKKILKLNQKLRRRVTELQTLLDMIPIDIGIAKDPECQTIKMNPAFAKLLKMPFDQNASLSAPVGERPTTFKIFREGRELTEKELSMQYAAAHGVEILDSEVDVIYDDGTVVNLLEYVVPLFDEDGKSRGCIGAFLDITERKQSEKLLRNHQEWLEYILNWMPIPMILIEPETARVTFANQAADKLAGGEFPKNKPAEEYHTVYYCTDAAGDRIPNEQMPGVRVARGESLAGVELDWHNSGGIRSLLIYSDTLPAIHGYPKTCIMTLQNVTELKQVEKDLLSGYENLQLLFNTANSLLSSQEPVDLIDGVFRELAEQIDLDVYFNYVVIGNSPVIRLASYTGVSEELAQEIEILEFGQAVCGTVALTQQPIVLDHINQSTDPITQLIRAQGITAFYAYPLIAQGRLVGTLSFGSRSLFQFNENQRAMMQAVCEQVAIAIDRANLITSLQTQTEQLREANRMKDEFLAILSHELRSPLNAIVGWSHLLRNRKFSEDQIAQGLETIERNAKKQNQLIDDLLDISRIVRGKLKFNPRTCDLVPIINSAIETVSLAAQAKEINLHFYPYSGESWESREETSPFLLSASSVIVSGDSDRLQQIIWNLLTNAIKFTSPGGNVEIRLNKITIDNPELKNSREAEGNRSRGEEITSVILQAEGSNYQQLPLRKYAQIQVIDNGVGISADFLPYVFDRFRQADSSSTRSYGGLGLGLSLVRHLTELHGGTVHVESLGEHQGSIFTVNLPLLEESRNTETQKYREKTEKSASVFLDSATFLPILEGIKVLVVDDEADSREFISTVLEECQAEVKVVSSAQEALQMLTQWTPDVLISDIGMPEEDGYSLIRKVRSAESSSASSLRDAPRTLSLSPEKSRNIPAAALTAYAGVEDRMRAIQAGFELHLPKPIEPAELATVVASLVKRNLLY